MNSPLEPLREALNHIQATGLFEMISSSTSHASPPLTFLLVNHATQTEIANLQTPTSATPSATYPPPIPTTTLAPVMPDFSNLNQTELHLAAARGDIRSMTTLIHIHPGFC